MRTIRNLAWFLLAFTLTVWAGLASAQERWYNATVSGFSSARWPAQLEACQKALAAAQSKGSALDWTITGYNSTQLSCIGKRGTATTSWTNGSYTSGLCPTSTPFLSGGFCVATKPEPEPEPPPQTCPYLNGTKFTFHLTDGTGPKGAAFPTNPSPFPRSSDECYLHGAPEVKNCYAYPLDDKTDQFACTYEGVSNGQNVDKTQAPGRALSPEQADEQRKDVPPKEGNENGCPKGTVNAGLSASGIPMCIGTGTDPKNKPPSPPKVETEKTETSEDGTKTTTKTETTKNSDGSETVVKTVTITKPDGTKEVSQDKTTTKTPSNAPGKDDSKQDDEKYDLCKQNPHLTICQNSSVAGKCGEISCMGDAIQCATLRAAAAMQCKQQSDEEALKASPLAAKGQAAIDGTDLSGLPGPTNGEVVNIPTLDSQGWLGNGAGFTDVSISLQGHQVVLPLSKVTEYLLPLRYVLMLVASLVSYRILAGAVLKE